MKSGLVLIVDFRKKCPTMETIESMIGGPMQMPDKWPKQTARPLATWFCEAIATSGKTQNEIAGLLGLQNNAVSKIKAGRRDIRAEEMLILSEELGIPLPSMTKKASVDYDLFDKAYTEVVRADQSSTVKMHPKELLNEVHHTYLRLLEESPRIGA
ncbi:helix-turn-helix domain-containing protein [Roseibium algae]|uniref:Helix-turn-helix transcriptional regulator n=1 Tax=Roseibium algae TaxID=3123038 RepID=A0ABU8TKT4_9HYPH